MIITSRTHLDRALNDPCATILLLAGSRTSDAFAVHEHIKTITLSDWRVWYLLPDVTTLTPAERASWLDGLNDRYCSLGGTVPKQIGKKGPISELFRSDGVTPSTLRVRQAFVAGDRL